MNMMNNKNRFSILIVVLLCVGGFYLFRQDVTDTSIDYTAPLPPEVAALNDPESVSAIIKEAGTGREYISNQLIVEFESTVSEADALASIAAVSGKMMQRFTAVPLFLVQVKDSGDGAGLQKAKSALERDVRVKKVELNYLTSLPTPTTDDAAADTQSR